LVEARIQDADLPRLLDGATHVFHLAAQAGVRKSWGTDFRHYIQQNIEATQVLLEACARAPLQRLVYASSSSVYGDAAPIPMREDQMLQPVSPYGVTKLAAEHLCHLYQVNLGVPAVSVRYFTVYGPRQRPDMGFHRFLKAALAAQPIHLYGDGGQTRDFTFVRDAVAATCSAGTRGTPGRVYNIGGGSRVSVNEVLALIGRLVGRPLEIRHEATQKGDMRDTYADTSLAKRDLAYAPSVGLEEGLAAELQWLTAMPATS
jgi:UDP-glucose 4-epimerase